VIGPLTGGSLNPARTFGPLVIATIGGGDYDAVALPRAFDEVAPAQGTQGDIEGRRERVAEPAAEPGRQGTGGDIAGRRS
jgi:glycerol uptake facilitator protein